MRHRIVIVGDGFAGFYAALDLDRTVARDEGVEVLLIDAARGRGRRA